MTIDEELKKLAKEINASHASAVKSVDDAITDSLTTGVKLIEARNKVKHGEWTSWVEANLSFGLRRVQQYIQMVERKYAINGDSLLDICLMITRYDREHPVTSAPVEVKSEETSLIAPTEVETKIQVKTAETTRELRSGTPQRKGPAPTCKISYAEHQRQLKNAVRQGIEQEDKRKEDSSAYEEFIKVLLELMKRDG